MTLDTTIVTAFHGVAAGSPVLRVVSSLLATWLAVAALVAAAIALVAFRRDRAVLLGMVAAYLRAAAAALIAYAANAGIGVLVGRSRPFAALGFEPFTGAPLTAKSFPSDHAALAFAVAATFAYAWPQRRWAFIAVAAAIALGRVMAGVHYPSDVLAGAALGAFWAWLVETVDVRGGGAVSLRIARKLTRTRV
jgi:undecaprenyl-diphosphatase